MPFPGVCTLLHRGRLQRLLLRQAAEGALPLLRVQEVTHGMVPFERDHALGATLHVAQSAVVVKRDIKGLHDCADHGICGAGKSV